MKLHVLSRKTHYWAAIVVALPVVVILATGILLQVKKQVAWVQPAERKGTAQAPTISFPRLLEVCRAVPEARIAGWSDIDRIDVRPGRGILKVLANNRWEIQVDGASGAVLQVAYRRSDLIESLHDGSWFHADAKLWLFLPAGVTLLLLWLTGLYMFWLPLYVKARRRRQATGRSRTPAASRRKHGHPKEAPTP